MCALYVLEKQPHIPQLQLYVNASAASTALSIQETSITLRINPPTLPTSDDTSSHTQQQPQTLVIPLDCRVKMAQPPTTATAAATPPTPASLSITKAADACLIRIALHRAYTDATSTLSPSLPSASELLPASYPALYCRRCLCPLLVEPPLRVRPLPSSHWSELTDLWYCHNTNDNSYLDQLVQHAVKAQQHTLLVGREELRLHSTATTHVVVGDTVVREQKRERTRRQQCGHDHHATPHVHDEAKEERKEQHTDSSHSDERLVMLPSLLYRQARCEQCEADLGWCVSESVVESSGSEVWLHKHRIINVLQDDVEATTATPVEPALLSALSSLNVSAPVDVHSPASAATGATPPAIPVPSLFLRHYTVETYLSSRLLSLCEARCTFRFLIRPVSSPSHANSTARHLHLVVLNIDTAIACPGTTQDGCGSGGNGEMQPVVKVAYNECGLEDGRCKGEVVELSAVDMTEVQLLLQQQSEWLPVDFRRMDQQTLSYLRRLSSD